MTEHKRNSLTAALSYRDPQAAIDWLQKAFGFEPAMILTDKDGKIAHSEMRFGDSLVMIGGEWSADHRSPASIGGKNTQSVHVHLDEDVDSHCARAREAGAVIIQEPDTQFYGDRTYRARDPEGHIWTFGQSVRQVSPEEWDKASGLVTTIYA